MKKNLLGFGKDFVVRDGLDRDQFILDGRAFSTDRKLSIQDMNGHELAFVALKALDTGPAYEIHRHGTLRAVTSKSNFSFFRCRFSDPGSTPGNLDAEGDLLDHEYAFTRSSRLVAVISRKWFSWAESYGVEIADDEDHVLVLAGAVIIDILCHGAGP